jgi:hypothetical protein
VADDRNKKKLRVLEEDGPTEDVLRLGEEGEEPESVEKILLPPKPEQPERLEHVGGVENFDRRSMEPDIDTIIGLEERTLDDDLEWMRDGDSKPVPYGWFVLIFLVIAGLVATSAVLILRSSGGLGQEAKQAAVERLEEDAEEDQEALKLVEAVEATLRKYIAADSVEDLLPLVRDPERVRPLMDAWYARNPIEPRAFGGLGVFQPLDLEGRLFWLITCGVKGDDSETILMEQTEDGRVFVDWETQVCHQPMPWDEFVEKRPEGEDYDFRLYLQPDLGGFFSHEFGDEEKWSVYRLSAKDSEEYLFGYVARGSELEKTLIELTRSNRGYPVALLLRLNIPKGTKSPRGVLIEELISKRWALVEPLTGG